MATSIKNTALRARRQNYRPCSTNRNPCRFKSSTSSYRLADAGVATQTSSTNPAQQLTTPAPALARLSTSSILRTLLLSTFFTSPLLFKPGFAIFHKIANSSSALLNPDRNPVLRAIIYPLVYKQFCAGRNRAEIEQTSAQIRHLGFAGVVLCYGKEVQVAGDNDTLVGSDASYPGTLKVEIDQWKHGNLDTLDMAGQGDWLGIKFTGAGYHITKALMQGEEAPPEFIKAMEEICERASLRDCRIWIDSEQQVLQPTIDKWTIPLMRRFNRAETRALIYNTVQAYLKSSREKIQHQLQLAEKEGWRLGVKLVRGAYISNDIRERIHNTKAETDRSYDGIVEDLLRGNFSTGTGQQTTNLDLVLAGHNSATIRKATRLAIDLAAQSSLKAVPEFAQLQGMADDVGCEIVQIAEDLGKSGLPGKVAYIPRVYKCLTWGSIQECMQYLTRRLVENRGAADRMRGGAAEFRKELYRRMRDPWRKQVTKAPTS
ncbi:proline dehydrogenase [Elasticomyces elasticus]|uniref:Proline dehydrogenase n=1 Tax=Exophiala sideris TaxID=1016849 RepID=A0ABR0JGD5_9EURO|nr:proline dehydrogenase [Elasticomyces elasticus]KAK5033168.1 proline dehydrogenase [Exophiala sideris]KAK5042332.1 proline dehydrogenase [Exophiala sideris]KAK5063712.1 proline dehydrogenase [Exophiala sideris]KAK5185599.1 proline dehydrogenase [Eurotiomycetes sp. CCFEE 6388]